MLIQTYSSVTEIQRNFKKVAKKAKNARDGVIVLSNNRPVGVYTDYTHYLITAEMKAKAKNDLLSLAGTMTAQEVDKLNKDMDEMFEGIDEEEWK